MGTIQILRRILSVIFPSFCSYCKSPLGDSDIPYFCTTCWKDFALLTGPVCPRCGTLFGSPEALSHSPEHECGWCRKKPPEFDQALSVG